MYVVKNLNYDTYAGLEVGAWVRTPEEAKHFNSKQNAGTVAMGLMLADQGRCVVREYSQTAKGAAKGA